MERLLSPKESILVEPQLKMLYNFQEIPIMECHLGWISLIKVTNWTFKKSKIVYLKLSIFPHLYPTSQIKAILRDRRKSYLTMWKSTCKVNFPLIKIRRMSTTSNAMLKTTSLWARKTYMTAHLPVSMRLLGLITGLNCGLKLEILIFKRATTKECQSMWQTERIFRISWMSLSSSIKQETIFSIKRKIWNLARSTLMGRQLLGTRALPTKSESLLHKEPLGISKVFCHLIQLQSQTK